MLLLLCALDALAFFQFCFALLLYQIRELFPVLPEPARVFLGVANLLELRFLCSKSPLLLQNFLLHDERPLSLAV